MLWRLKLYDFLRSTISSEMPLHYWAHFSFPSFFLQTIVIRGWAIPFDLRTRIGLHTRTLWWRSRGWRLTETPLIRQRWIKLIHSTSEIIIHEKIPKFWGYFWEKKESWQYFWYERQGFVLFWISSLGAMVKKIDYLVHRRIVIWKTKILKEKKQIKESKGQNQRIELIQFDPIF